MNLDSIKNNTTWEDAATAINSNFSKTNLEVAKIASSSNKHKGFFTTEAALLVAQPYPRVGDNAYVGATYPGVVYVCNTTGVWNATTTVPSPPAVNISEYYKKVETDTLIDTVLNEIHNSYIQYLDSTEEIETKTSANYEQIYAVGTELNQNLIISYLTFNHSAIGGEFFYGMQLSYYYNGVLTKSSNYKIYAANLEPGKIYELQGVDGDMTSEGIRVFIKTSANYVYSTDSLLYSGRIIQITNWGKGSDIAAFIGLAKRGYVLVAKNGEGDYNTVSAAAAASPVNTAIHIKSGTYYNEVVIASYSKKLSFIGEDKLSTIVQNSQNDYDNPVFLIGAGCIKNLTIFANNASNITTPNEQYALHVESATLYNDTLLVEDCIIKSSFGEPLGMGMRGGCKVEFNRCDFVMESPSTTYDAAVYFHDSEEVEYVGEQNVSFRNCLIYSPNKQYAIRMQSQERSGSTINIEMIGNRIKCAGTPTYNMYNYRGGTPSSNDFLGLINARLKETSWGNNDSSFNVD